MRITFVLPYAGLAGGIRVVAIYAERLRRRGHDVFVVSTPRRLVPIRRKVKSLLTGRGWPRATLELSHLDGTGVPHYVIDRWRPVVDADIPDADVVVATWWLTAEWVAALSPAKGAKAILLQGYEVLPGGENPRLDTAWRLPLHKIVISRWLFDLARDKFGDVNVSHVPNAVDVNQFFAPRRGKQTRPTVGFLYHTAPIKGCDVSIKAICQASRAQPALRAVSFGAEAPTARLPLPQGTEYFCRPAQERIRDIYAQCDVWVCGSRREGFHLPPLEAMACRCPVVSTRVGGPLDIIRGGENGYFVNVEDSAALAERMLRVLALPDPAWRVMSDTAYATATRYTWDDATNLFEAALEKAIERWRRGRVAAHGLGA